MIINHFKNYLNYKNKIISYFSRVLVLAPLVCLSSLAACSTPHPQHVLLKPIISPSLNSNTRLGAGQVIILSAKDTRGSRKVGDYGPSSADRADILVEDLSDSLFQSLKDGFNSKGFIPTKATPENSASSSTPTAQPGGENNTANNSSNKSGIASARYVEVTLQSINYKVSTELMKQESSSQAVLLVNAQNGNKTLTKRYAAEQQGKITTLSSAKKNELNLDGVLSDVTAKLLEDTQLLMFLSQ